MGSATLWSSIKLLLPPSISLFLTMALTPCPEMDTKSRASGQMGFSSSQFFGILNYGLSQWMLTIHLT
ncbi:hypothetical protein HKD37_14G040315 [Glycine soja]